ncbi:MAG: TIGR02757 family protein [Flavobacteriaceae bacterium]
MNKKELKAFLDEKAALYEHPRFIETDPIQIPHGFRHKADIEIAGFLTATISWGNRKAILKSARNMMNLMGNTPYDFVSNYKSDALPPFVHRTFNSQDLHFMCLGLQRLYAQFQDMDAFFAQLADTTVAEKLHHFRAFLLQSPHKKRSEKHLSDPLKGSAAKRLNMFLRWMVRDAKAGVDFGLWQSIDSSQLSVPLDVHTATIARKLKLLKRKQNDQKALQELDQQLRKMNPNDPVRYDFALFGLGAFEKF